MQESARYQAIFEIIEQVFSDKQPADNILNSYFRERRYIGSKDRRFISENVWDIIRHRRRLEFEAQSTSIRRNGGYEKVGEKARAYLHDRRARQHS